MGEPPVCACCEVRTFVPHGRSQFANLALHHCNITQYIDVHEEAAMVCVGLKHQRGEDHWGKCQ